MPSVPRDVRTSTRTEALTGIVAAAAFFVFGGLPTTLFSIPPQTLVAAALVPIPVGAVVALGRSSRRAATALTHRGFRFLVTLSFSLSLVLLVFYASPGVRLGVVSYLVGMAATNWYLYAVADVEYAGDEGRVRTVE